MKYKDTLNLPSTKFPMKANLSQKELELLTYWKKINLYNEIRKNTKNCNQFILHDGPPYANGDIHIGHAVNKILKDFVIKSKTFSGYDVPFIPGWDCHGLPIELKVEKKFGKSKFKDDNNAFRKACREYANQQIQKQTFCYDDVSKHASAIESEIKWPYCTCSSHLPYSNIDWIQNTEQLLPQEDEARH